jgi:hypothetical protein
MSAMGTHSNESAIRSLRRRHFLLDAWLEAMERLEAPRCRITFARNNCGQRRLLIQSTERHPIGRRRPPYPAISRQGH